VNKPLRLRRYRTDHLGMAVAHIVHCYSGYKVQILPAIRVPDMGSAAAHEKNILAAVGLDDGCCLTILDISLIGHIH